MKHLSIATDYMIDSSLQTVLLGYPKWKVPCLVFFLMSDSLRFSEIFTWDYNSLATYSGSLEAYQSITCSQLLKLSEVHFLERHLCLFDQWM